MASTTNNSSAGQSFDPYDVEMDETNGIQVIDALLAEFAAHVQTKYPGNSTSKVPRPYVFRAALALADADFGISDEMVGEYDGLLVIVPHYAHMKVGDTVRLYWDGKLVAFDKVEAGQENSFVALFVNEADVPKGLKTMYCKVQPKGGSAEKSPTVTTQVRYDQPGVEGANGVGEELAAPEVDLPASGAIGLAEAQAKVKVTIPAYLNMNTHDVIHLFWGDQVLEHEVTQAQVGKPVVIEVDEAILRSAGDSDALSVYYFVQDDVGNESEWSQDTWVKVNLLAGSLDAPVILEDDGSVNSTGEVDLNAFQAQELLVEVSGAFQVGDNIVLHWQGTSAQGQAVPLQYGPQQVAQAGAKQSFQVPFAVLTSLGDGSARLHYTVERAGIETPSKNSFLNIKGVALKLPAPVLDQAEDDWVDADHQDVRLVIPQEAAFQDGDEVTLEWRGTASDGSALFKTGRLRATNKQVGKRMLVAMKGVQYLKPIEGGYVEVSYSLKRGKATYWSERATYYVGYLAETLPAPFTDPQLANNTLDPDLDIYDQGMEISIPVDAEQPAPCTVYLYWNTSEGNYYEDEQVLEAGDKASPFLVPVDQLQVTGSKPVQVEVYYEVSWPGKPTLASADFVFTIATAAMQRNFFAAPQVPVAKGDKLHLMDVPPKGLEVTVPAFTGMAPGDSIVVKYGTYASEPHVVDKIGIQTINLPFYEVAKQGLKQASVFYEVTRVSTTQVSGSQILGLEIVGEAVVPMLDSLAQGSYSAGGFKLPTVDLHVLQPNLQITYYGSSPYWKPVGVKNAFGATNRHIAPTYHVSSYQMTLKKPARKVTFWTHYSGRSSHYPGNATVTAADAQGTSVAQLAVEPKGMFDAFYEVVAPQGQSITSVTVTAPRGQWLGLGLIVFVY